MTGEPKAEFVFASCIDGKKGVCDFSH